MTRSRSRGTRLGTFALGLFLAACSSDDANGGGEAPSDVSPRGGSELRSDAKRIRPHVSEAASAAASEQAFAISFLHALEEDKNTTFSPHSISATFAMLTDAASGATLNEVRQVLQFPATDEAFHRSQDALQLGLAARNVEGVAADGRQVTQIFSESNDIWIRGDIPPQDSYLDTLARYYGVGVSQADFGNNPEGARQAINAQVAEDTRDLIAELLPEGALDELTVAVLTNALYFKASWASTFKPSTGDFNTLTASTVSTAMLGQEMSLAYYEGDGFVSVAVPYWGGDVEMLLVVPDAGNYSAVRANLSSALLDTLLSERKPELVRLWLPKFSLESTLPATDVLKRLGMRTPFDELAADFPKFDSPRGSRFCLKNVFHQATVAIDEKGTEASAATADVGTISIGGLLPSPKIVTVDRPFLFLIRDNPTGSVLFIGQVVNPSER